MPVGYPLFLKLRGRKCLVFGGGKVAGRKIQSLVKRGARVTCLSRDFSRPIQRLAREKQIVLKRVAGNRISLDGANLVIVATSDRNFNQRIAEACRKKKIWVNVVDDPELCDFYAPAVLERGPLQVAISTDGTSPLFAKRLREELEKVIPPSTGHLLDQLGKIRSQHLHLRRTWEELQKALPKKRRR